MTKSMSNIKGLIFDLDHCLYRERNDASRDFSTASKKTLVEAYPELEGRDIEALTKDSFHKHGNDIAAFSAEYGYPNGQPYMQLYQSFHKHALPLVQDMFVPQNGLVETLETLKNKMRFVVLTHAPMEWAVSAIEIMGLTKILSPKDVYSQDHPSINGKRKDLHTEPFEVALDHLGFSAQETAFLDDSQKNHITARKINLHTVHVHWDNNNKKSAAEPVAERSHGPVPFLRKLVV